MTFVRGWSFDEFDVSSDVSIYNGQISVVDLSSSVPLGMIGNSLIVQGVSWGNAYLKLPFPEQSGKTINLGVRLLINTQGVLINIEDVTDGSQLTLSINAAGRFVLKRGNTILSTGTQAHTFGAWYDIQLKALIHSSAGLCAVYINGNSTPDINITGVNTQNQSTDLINILLFGYSTTTDGSAASEFYVYLPILFNTDELSDPSPDHNKLFHPEELV